MIKSYRDYAHKKGLKIGTTLILSTSKDAYTYYEKWSVDFMTVNKPVFADAANAET